MNSKSIPNLEGKALSVLGPVNPADLGITLMHEHLVVPPMPSWTRKPGLETPATEAAFWDQPLGLDNLSQATVDHPFIRDQYFLHDEKLSIAEVMEFKFGGGSTLVDLTSIGVGRDPEALRRIALSTGLQIIMGSGWYTKNSYDETVSKLGVQDLADIIINDVTIGVGNSNIRSGIIGEIGVSDPMDPMELKVIKAAARASRVTGAAISLHWGGRNLEKHLTADTIKEEGAELSRTIFGHSDLIAGDNDQMIKLLNRGVYIQFDLLGRAAAHLTWGPQDGNQPWADYLWMSGSALVAKAVKFLISQGFLNRILLSQDICTKVQLKRYGGTGYSYIIEEFIPHLIKEGISEKELHTIMIDNPRRILTFRKPVI